MSGQSFIAGCQRRGRRPPDDRAAADIFCAGLCRRGFRPSRRPDRAAAQLLFEGGSWLDGASGQRLSHDLQFSLDHQADLRRVFRFRAAVRLSPQALSPRRQCRRGRRLLLGHPAHRARSFVLGARAHRLRHGDIEHRMRGRAGGERTAARRERPLRQSAMAVVQRRHDGRLDRRRGTHAAPVAGCGAAYRGGNRRRCAVGGPVRDDLSDPGQEDAHRSSGAARDLRQSRDRIQKARALDRRTFPLSLLLQSGLEHAALLLHDRRSEILAKLYRHSRINRRSRLGRGRAPLSPTVRWSCHCGAF